MSDKAEELAKQLLEKTEAGKLQWHIVPETASGDFWVESEDYRADLEDGYSFSIKRMAKGDDKMLTLALSQPGRVVLSAQADNFTLSLERRTLMERGRQICVQGDESKLFGSVNTSKIERFRLFSDLFYAARKNAVGGDQTIEKVQQLLERLG
jgi:hypothetical protein